MKGQKVVVRYEHQRALIETPFHSLVEFLSEDTASIKISRASVGSLSRPQRYVRGIIVDCEVEDEIVSCLGILLLGKTIEANGGQVCRGEWDVRWI